MNAHGNRPGSSKLRIRKSRRSRRSRSPQSPQSTQSKQSTQSNNATEADSLQTAPTRLSLLAYLDQAHHAQRSSRLLNTSLPTPLSFIAASAAPQLTAITGFPLALPPQMTPSSALHSSLNGRELITTSRTGFPLDSLSMPTATSQAQSQASSVLRATLLRQLQLESIAQMTGGARIPLPQMGDGSDKICASSLTLIGTGWRSATEQSLGNRVGKLGGTNRKQRSSKDEDKEESPQSTTQSNRSHAITNVHATAQHKNASDESCNQRMGDDSNDFCATGSILIDNGWRSAATEQSLGNREGKISATDMDKKVSPQSTHSIAPEAADSLQTSSLSSLLYLGQAHVQRNVWPRNTSLPDIAASAAPRLKATTGLPLALAPQLAPSSALHLLLDEQELITTSRTGVPLDSLRMPTTASQAQSQATPVLRATLLGQPQLESIAQMTGGARIPLRRPSSALYTSQLLAQMGLVPAADAPLVSMATMGSPQQQPFGGATLVSQSSYLPLAQSATALTREHLFLQLIESQSAQIVQNASRTLCQIRALEIMDNSRTAEQAAASLIMLEQQAGGSNTFTPRMSQLSANQMELFSRSFRANFELNLQSTQGVATAAPASAFHQNTSFPVIAASAAPRLKATTGFPLALAPQLAPSSALHSSLNEQELITTSRTGDPLDSLRMPTTASQAQSQATPVLRATLLGQPQLESIAQMTGGARIPLRRPSSALYTSQLLAQMGLVPAADAPLVSMATMGSPQQQPFGGATLVSQSSYLPLAQSATALTREHLFLQLIESQSAQIVQNASRTLCQIRALEIMDNSRTAEQAAASLIMLEQQAGGSNTFTPRMSQLSANQMELFLRSFRANFELNLQSTQGMATAAPASAFHQSLPNFMLNNANDTGFCYPQDTNDTKEKRWMIRYEELIKFRQV